MSYYYNNYCYYFFFFIHNYYNILMYDFAYMLKVVLFLYQIMQKHRHLI